MLNNTIAPALSPEEWAIVEADKGLATEERAALLGRVDQAGRVAAYNAVLPDGHPVKLTHEDAQLVRQAAFRQERYRAVYSDIGYCRRCSEPIGGSSSYRWCDACFKVLLYALADKLAALLPPDPH